MTFRIFNNQCQMGVNLQGLWHWDKVLGAPGIVPLVCGPPGTLGIVTERLGEQAEVRRPSAAQSNSDLPGGMDVANSVNSWAPWPFLRAEDQS